MKPRLSNPSHPLHKPLRLTMSAAIPLLVMLVPCLLISRELPADNALHAVFVVLLAMAYAGLAVAMAWHYWLRPVARKLRQSNRPVTSVQALAQDFTLTTKMEPTTCKINPTRI